MSPRASCVKVRHDARPVSRLSRHPDGGATLQRAGAHRGVFRGAVDFQRHRIHPPPGVPGDGMAAAIGLARHPVRAARQHDPALVGIWILRRPGARSYGHRLGRGRPQPARSMERSHGVGRPDNAVFGPRWVPGVMGDLSRRRIDPKLRREYEMEELEKFRAALPPDEKPAEKKPQRRGTTRSPARPRR